MEGGAENQNQLWALNFQVYITGFPIIVAGRAIFTSDLEQ